MINRTNLIRKRFVLLLFLPLLAVSCGEGQEKNAMTYTVVRASFSDDIVLSGTTEAVRTSLVLCSDEVRWLDGIIVYMAEDGELVTKGDTVCILESSQLEQEKETLMNLIETNQAAYDLGVANLESEYARLEAEARNNELQAALSDLDSLQMLYYSASQRKVSELNLQKARIQQEKIERNLEVTRLVNGTELKKLGLKLKQSRELEEYYQSILDQLVLTAPAGGMFLRAHCWDLDRKYDVGDMVQDEILARIPELSEMQVAIAAPEQMYKRLVVGQPVTFSFDAMPGSYAYGRISQKSPVGHPMRRNSTLTVYDVLAVIDSAEVLPNPALSANCKVNITTLCDTFPVPLVTVFDRDSMRVVYVREGAKYIEQEVKTGPFSSHEVVVTAGLQGGERLSYVRPKPSAILRTQKLNTRITDTIE